MAYYTRREFLVTGAKGAVLVAVPMAFNMNPLAAFASPGEDSRDVNDYLNLFGVDTATLNQVMAEALRRGGDYCDLFFQHSRSTQLRLEDNVVNLASTTVDLGVGIRVIKGDQVGFSFTEDLNLAAMKQAASTAAAIADSGSGATPAALVYHPAPDYYRIETDWADVGVDTRIPILERVNKRMAAADSRVIKTSVSMLDGESRVLVACSDGRLVCDFRPMTAITGVCTSEQDGRKETGYETFAGRIGIEYHSEPRLDELADRASKRALLLFDAVKPEPGEMEVVLGAGDSGILLHEAIGHGMEADFNRKGRSIFSDKINKKVAEDFVHIVDDATNPNLRGSLNIDDEGNDTEKTFLVENGILRTYLHDRISARHYAVKPTGSGRRQSFRHPVLPRMRNTYMLNGPHTREEVIASVKKGIFCEYFANGEVAIGPGDFTFYVKVGYLIEDGKLTRPIKDINLIGNGPEVLSRIVMVADDFAMSPGGWTCGKNGQSVAVSLGMPTVKVSSITVGGVA